MASEKPAPSSQQPFASPQPAPVHPAAQAASPPTKQSLRNWWKGFKPAAKTQETHGNSPHITHVPRFVPTETPYHPQTFAEQLGMPLPPIYFCGVEKCRMCDRSYLSNEEVSQTTSDGKQTIAASPLPWMSVYPLGRQKKLHHFNNRQVLPWCKQSDDVAETVKLPPSPKTPPLAQSFRQVICNSESPEALAKLRMKAVEQPTGIFGVPLRQSITYANVAISLVDGDGKSYIYGYVPIVVAKCGVFLKEKATNVEGIFRLSGSEKRIKELKTIFDSPDRYGKGLDWAGYTVHDAANVLRRYLNQLPEPIVPLDLYVRFREPLKGHTLAAVGDSEGPQAPGGNFDADTAIATYQQLITELPPLNRQLLLYILDLLAVFASKSDENRMNSQNLAAIFQPGMLSHPQHDMAPAEYRLSQDVLIFLIENQDHFLIGMRGTEADEKTVQDVQNGSTPPPGTPNTPSKLVGRSASNASAGADSVRKYGGVRRNVSVSSRHSRQSNGAQSPASPSYGPSLTNTPSGGVHRSNTVPSKRSPGLPSSRLQSPSPTGAAFSAPQPAATRGLPPGAPAVSSNRGVSPSSPGFATTSMGVSSLAPSSHPTSVTSQERLLPDQSEKQPDVSTPTRERNVSSFFQRSPTMDSEKRLPNKLRKKRIPGSSNPSAQSSTQSLNGQQSAAASPTVKPARGPQDVSEHTQLESIPSANRTLSNSEATPPLTETPRAEQPAQVPSRPEDLHHSPDRTLKPHASPTSSLHSRSSYNDQSQSDLDHVDDAAAVAEQKEKRSRWRLSRHRDTPQSLGNNLTPKKGLGVDNAAGASTSSVGSSSRPRKSSTGDTVPIGSDSTLVGTHLQSSNESGSAAGTSAEEKKGPLGWIKNKMREKREENKEKEAEKERNKSPPASLDRLASAFTSRGKSVDIKRDEIPERPLQEPAAEAKPQPDPEQP